MKSNAFETVVRRSIGKFFSLTQGAGSRRFLRFIRYKVPYRFRLSRSWDSDIRRINLLAVEHCTNSCKHCSTSSPFASKKVYSAPEFFPWLDLLEAGGARFSQIAITGGEPFLHHDLGSFIKQIKERYSHKRLAITTNFFWATEQKIDAISSVLEGLENLLISKYPNIVKKLGGNQRFDALVGRLRKRCPGVDVAVSDGSHMFAWSLYSKRQTPRAYCCTSDCFVLRPNGKISHCAIGAGIDNRPEFESIARDSKEVITISARGSRDSLPGRRNIHLTCASIALCGVG